MNWLLGEVQCCWFQSYVHNLASILNCLYLYFHALQVPVPSCVDPVEALSCVTPSCFVTKSSLPSLIPSFVRKKKDGKNAKAGTGKAKSTKPKFEMGYPVCIPPMFPCLWVFVLFPQQS